MFRIKAAWALVLAATLSMAAMPTIAAEPLTLRLDYLPTGYHAPLFYGLAKGFYRDEGIDLQIADGKGTNPALQSVAAGNDVIVLANYATMLESIAKGMPVVAIGGLIQRLPDSVFALEGSGITKPKDLEGRILGLSPSSAIFRLFPAFARAAGVDVTKVKIIQTQPSASLTSLLNGQVDAAAGWSFTDARKVAAQKPIAPPMLMADYGITVLGVGFVVRQDTAEKRGDLLRHFMAATQKSYVAAAQDPDAAVDAMLAVRSTLDRAVNLEQLNLLPPFLHTKASAGHPLGWMAASDWQDTFANLQTYFGLDEKVDLAKVFTNDFVSR